MSHLTVLHRNIIFKHAFLSVFCQSPGSLNTTHFTNCCHPQTSPLSSDQWKELTSTEDHKFNVICKAITYKAIILLPVSDHRRQEWYV